MSIRDRLVEGPGRAPRANKTKQREEKINKYILKCPVTANQIIEK